MAALRIVLASLIVCATACGLVYDPDTLESDFGKACGKPGEPCCADNTCSSGATCMSKLDAGACSCDPLPDGAVAEAGACKCECVACGGPGKACCEGDICTGSGLTCASGKCTGCGAAGEACCDGAVQCAEGLSCESGTCSGCGVAGAPCCAATTACKSATLACDPGSNTCQSCGQSGQLCCGGIPCNSGNLVCNGSGRCEACGGQGQLCCTGNGCNVPSLVCQGTCVPCGYLGAPCCQGGEACPGDPVCSAGTCMTCCARCSRNGVRAAANCVYSGLGDCSSAAVNYCRSLGQNYLNHFWTTNCDSCKW